MIKIAVFDIETTHLNADFGIILCTVIRPAHGNYKVFRGDQLAMDWESKRSDDSLLVAAVAKELASYDLLIAHNGLKFDLPFIRTRMAKWGMEPLPQLKIMDPVQIARSYLRMSYNSLDRIAEFLGVNLKTRVDSNMWVRAALDGDRKAMDYIVEHCKRDVKTLYDIVDSVKGYSRAFDSWGSK